ncbi:FG-GAP-like repeat-containing protein [Methylocystis parvus]|uniref:FG-GAP-like repeat-containing protein n=1 Tax=Methylocystis parvus TaxID=134 RepID=UPI003C709958
MISKKNWLRSASACALILSSSIASATTVIVVNKNAAGVGFNDPTPATPVGGNTGTTVGAQRLIAFQAAADLWATHVVSNVPIRVGAQFTALTCNATSAVLGSAGPATVHRDFPGAPVASTWYTQAEANSLAGVDQDPTNDDINANFNSNLGQTGCLEGSGWYYGLDSKPPAGIIDFMSVLIHELGHGLGFLSLVNLSTGAKFNGGNDAYMLNLENHGATPPDYPSMSDAQRVAASISGANLHWTGLNVRIASPILTAGKTGDHVQMYAPNPAQGGSSVSHWNTAAFPNQIMEPSYTVPLHSPILERPLFRDLGWKLLTPRIDFTGDGKADILWRDTSNGNAVVSVMNGAAITSSTFVANLPTSWTVAGTGDFNFDGKSDILWRNTTGDAVVSLMDGANITSSTFVANLPTSWTVAGTGDFNGDGKSDILWRNSTGDAVVSLMNGPLIASSTFIANLPSTWSVPGVGDFNGDGKADILWRDNNGNAVVSLMNGAVIASSTFIATLPLTWSVAGTGDFNADGKRDILWRDSTNGNAVVSIMNGATIISSTFVATLPLSWAVSQVADFNSDGKNDILWRDTSNGNTVVSLMNGASIVSSTFVANLPTSWAVQGVNAN